MEALFSSEVAVVMVCGLAALFVLVFLSLVVLGVNLKRLPESGILAAVVFLMERASGIEPPSKAWEASILPMNYARVIADLIILPLFVAFCKFVFERGDGGQDGDVGVAGEGLGAGGAGGDGEEVDSGIVGGLGVDVAVAGVEDVVFGHVEVVDGA